MSCSDNADLLTVSAQMQHDHRRSKPPLTPRNLRRPFMRVHIELFVPLSTEVSLFESFVNVIHFSERNRTFLTNARTSNGARWKVTEGVFTICYDRRHRLSHDESLRLTATPT